jgi:hypothetical protein
MCVYWFLKNADMILQLLHKTCGEGVRWGRLGGTCASRNPGSTAAQLCDLGQISQEWDSVEVPTQGCYEMDRVERKAT